MRPQIYGFLGVRLALSLEVFPVEFSETLFIFFQAQLQDMPKTSANLFKQLIARPITNTRATAI